jgi:precorrin-8X/cobalt-precorrin-8 methylmutase
MNPTTPPTGILVVSHGSPLTEANERFVALVGRIAARLDADNLRPAFFSLARPNIADRVAELAARGVRRIVLLPYFLYAGQHVTHDIPALLDECRRQFPAVAFEVLPTLESDPALEDLVVERLAAVAASPAALPTTGEEIQRRSYQIIARTLDAITGAAVGATAGLPSSARNTVGQANRGTRDITSAELADDEQRKIVQRIVHATADFSFIRSLRIHPEAVRRGRDALAAGRPVLCDVKMLAAGMTHVRNEVVCAIGDPRVAALAAEKQCTRAAAAMELLAPRLAGAIVAIGNAPTALAKLLQLVRDGGPRPALVVGLPVGLVGAREAKLALVESDLCYITNVTARGGSPAAAAAVNALASEG